MIFVSPRSTWRASGRGERSSHAIFMLLTTAPYSHSIQSVFHQGLLAPPLGKRRPPPPIALLVRVILRQRRPLQSPQHRRPIASFMVDAMPCLQRGALVASGKLKPTCTHWPSKETTARTCPSARYNNKLTVLANQAASHKRARPTNAMQNITNLKRVTLTRGNGRLQHHAPFAA